jgi:hypothetical protein
MDFATIMAQTSDLAAGLGELRNMFQREFAFDKNISLHSVQALPMVNLNKLTRQPENYFIILVTIQSPEIIVPKSELEKRNKTIN